MPDLEIEKLPPQSIEAEQSVLGCLLLDKDAIVKISDIIRPDDFYRDTHRMIFEAMLELYEAREPIDVVSLANKLKEKEQLEEIGGRSYLISLVNTVPTAAHVVNYAEIVQRKATLRRLIQAAQKITELGYQETEDVDPLLDKAERIIFNVSQKYLKQKFVPIKDVLVEAFDRIDDLHKEKGKLRGIPTGFKDLDNLLAGLQKSDLIILASRPSMGKSTLALDIARHVACKEKIPVGIFSLEMSKEQLVDRLLCAEANVELWRMRTGRLSDKEENDDFPKIGHAMGVLSEASIFIDDSPINNVMEIRTKARRLQAEQGLGLIVIDYLQLMEGRGLENRVQEVSEISRGLKAIARELNIPVLALSQLSRAVESRTPQIPQLADLRESGCLTGETLILRADSGEQIPIKNLVGKSSIPILTLDKDLKLKISLITKVFSSGKKLVYKMTTATGRTIRASANHPFLTLEGWKRLDQLKEGDRIAVPRVLSNVPLEDPPLEDDQLVLLAHLIGDGCYLKHQPLHYTSQDPSSINIVAQAAREAFNIQPRLVKQDNWFHVYLPAPFRLARNKRNPIVQWLDKDLRIFNQRSFNKIIPQQIFQQSLLKLSLFFKHLWATDGTISFNRKGNGYNWTIFYATKSEIMAKQIQHLLLRFGIISRVRKHKEKRKYKPGWVVDISGKEDQMKFLKQIGIFGEKNKKVKQALKHLKKIKSNPNCDIIPKEIWSKIGQVKDLYGISWRDFAKKYGMSYCGSTLFKRGVSRKRLRKILSFLPDKGLETLVNSDVYWDEITSIEKQGVEEVFDATVPGSHNFLANDIIVHNSIEQDADVVMFIYREEFYKPSTERQHIADIFVKKHRNGPTGSIELYFDPEKVTFRNLEVKHKG